MSISSTTSRNNYTGTSALHVYSYSFYIQDDDDLTVTVATAAGVETTLTKTTDYTVSGVGAANGGNVTLVNASQAWLTSGELTTGYTITIRRVMDLTQTGDIRNQGSFFPETHEDLFDRLVMQVQQLQDQLNRAIKFRETSTTTGIAFPEPVASKVPAWNSAGTALELVARSELATAEVRQGNTAILTGTASIAVTFSSVFADTTYSVVANLQNLTDASPQFQPPTITAKATTGFTATFNSAMDSANYALSWIATRTT